VDTLLDLGPLRPWFDRIEAFGHGTPTPMTAEAAFEVARTSTPVKPGHLDPNGDPGGLKAGTAVVVTPDDNARVPVRGTLVAASASEVVIHHRDAQAGDLHVHFPRLGFDVVAA
jgi:glutathione S-transferase